jgi:hypothetical protein
MVVNWGLLRWKKELGTQVRLVDEPKLRKWSFGFSHRSQDPHVRKCIPVFRRAFQELVDSGRMAKVPKIYLGQP